MKSIFFIACLLTTNLHAQTTLQFDKRFLDSEDKWVAFEANKEGAHSFGFIYIDAQAGLTLNYEGTFTISPSGEFIPAKKENAIMKVRLQPNNVLVAFIPESKFSELQIEAIPEWLQNYKRDTNSVSRLYRWGFLYNGWEECEKALTYLEKANQINPAFKGLAVELAFSYNCLGQYSKAVSVLQIALQQDPKDAYTNKELIYAQIRSGDLDKAAVSCKNAINICTDVTFHGENCYNLLHELYLKKDKANFNLWIAETKKWNAGKENIMSSIEIMNKELNQ
ncbi:MAG: hypothetical protein IPP93_12305 [Chitinophagaceae bacterium]|nr:hypothetical protein [Chitinophagaceae bacterium]